MQGVEGVRNMFAAAPSVIYPMLIRTTRLETAAQTSAATSPQILGGETLGFVLAKASRVVPPEGKRMIRIQIDRVIGGSGSQWRHALVH